MPRIIAVIAALATFLVNCGPGHAPAGQAALLEIRDNDLSSLKADFNAAADSVRVIVLMSPT